MMARQLENLVRECLLRLSPGGRRDLARACERFADGEDVVGVILECLFVERNRSIRATRLATGMSQREFARTVGISQSNLSDLENGSRAPSRRTREKMAAALKDTLAEVL